MADKLSEKDIDNISIEGTEEHAIMPLRNTVLFPQQVIPIYIGREKSLKLISDLESLDSLCITNICEALILSFSIFTCQETYQK